LIATGIATFITPPQQFVILNFSTTIHPLNLLVCITNALCLRLSHKIYGFVLVWLNDEVA
jgi:hypothetical protein